MEKLKMQTVNKADENFKKLLRLFPNAVTETINEEGEVIRAIDKDILMQEINIKVVEGQEERYQFTWPDKKKSVLLANAPISKTLRPCREESANFDTTENLYIEGDNLEVLKLLQETYLEKFDLIYIDPPYNTGNDILYLNDYSDSQEEYEEKYETDENGFKLFTNSDNNGKYHTNWLNMISQRIRLSKDLLKDTGFFCIAIDHNELFNLGQVCDEIFGLENRIGIITVIHKPEGRNQAKFIGPSNEFMLVYAKNQNNAKLQNVVLDPEVAKKYDKKDDRGNYRLQNFIRMTDGKLAYREVRPKFWYPIYVDLDTNKLSVTKEKLKGNIIEVYPKTKVGVEMSWKSLPKSAEELIEAGNLEINVDKDGFVSIMEKIRETQVIKTHWIRKEYNAIQYGTKVINELLEAKTFDFPKSLYLIEDVIKLFSPKDGMILDFFSGSATTAHATMGVNLEDNGKRKYVVAQIPAICDSKSEAYKAGYKNICEIGKERIRRAAKKLKEENPEKEFDGGFRVLKCDTSNMKDVYYNPSQYQNLLFDSLEDNIKEDRTPEDLLFQVMLDLGVLLSSKIEEEIIAGKKVFKIEENYLIACFDNEVTEETIEAIAKQKPYYFVMRDSSMANDSVATNFEQIFTTYSPETIRKVI